MPNPILTDDLGPQSPGPTDALETEQQVLAYLTKVYGRAPGPGDFTAARRLLRMAVGLAASLKDCLDDTCSSGEQCSLSTLADVIEADLSGTALEHLKVLDQFKLRDRKLLARLFVDGVRDQAAIKKASPAQTKLLRQYERVVERVVKSAEKAKDEPVRHTSVPRWIDQQPGLSQLDMRLLADIHFLSTEMRGCWKSDLAFAIDFNSRSAAINQRIRRLRRAGLLTFLKDYSFGRKRMLAVNTSKFPLYTEIESNGKEPGSPDAERDSSPTPRRGVPYAAKGSDLRDVGDCPTPRRQKPAPDSGKDADSQSVDLSSKPAESDNRLKGEPERKNYNAPDGASGRPSPSASGGYAPSTPAGRRPKADGSPVSQEEASTLQSNQDATGQEQSINSQHPADRAGGAEQPAGDEHNRLGGWEKESVKFIQFVKAAYPVRFKKVIQLASREAEVVRDFFRRFGCTALEIANTWSYGASLIGKEQTNADGTVYKHLACQATRNLAKFFEKIDRIAADILSYFGHEFSGASKASLLSKLEQQCPGLSKDLRRIFSCEYTDVQRDQERMAAERQALKEKQAALAQQAAVKEQRRRTERLANPTEKDIAQAKSVLAQRLREIKTGKTHGHASIIRCQYQDAIKVLRAAGETPLESLTQAKKNSSKRK